MDFFAQQDQARFRTAQFYFLFFLFLMAFSFVLGCVPCSGFLLFIALIINAAPKNFPGTMMDFVKYFLPYIIPGLVGASFFILLARVIRSVRNLQAGFNLVEKLGGRRVERNTVSAAELRLLNVVEEIALASGIPVPCVFVFDRIASINALAAGSRLEDAAVAVTAGCLDKLTREELQGIIAHEFSHILNGDMRLNLRMAALLAPIISMTFDCEYDFIGLEPDNNQKRSQFDLPALVGYAFGRVGSFFGKLIQCLISREREYLADAAAVQFTRNPAGFVSALKKIAGQKAAPAFDSQAAELASHMFFSTIRKSYFSTHPPIAERIRRIDPSFDVRTLPESQAKSVSFSEAIAPDRNPGMVLDLDSGTTAPASRFTPFRPESLAAGANLLAALPRELRFELNNEMGAFALVLALLLSRHAEVRSRQLAALEQMAAASLVEHVQRITGLLDALDVAYRLPLLDLAMPALRQHGAAQLEKLFAGMQTLVAADGKNSIFKLAVRKAIENRLRAGKKITTTDLNVAGQGSLSEQMLCVLSALAMVGHRKPDAADAAFNAALRELGERYAGSRAARRERLPLEELSRALDRLAAAAPKIKNIFLEACAACVLHEGGVRPAEAVLLRAVCYALNVPLPLFVKEKELSAWLKPDMAKA